MSSRLSVHPRTRGEHFRNTYINHLINGSSPHPRGSHWRFHPQQFCYRFIPAPAGNTIDHRPQPDHRILRFIPAPAGNTLRFGSVLCSTDFGSSPHPRGTRLTTKGTGGHEIRRFIPAPAGNTFPLQRCQRFRAHGSSPHPRGTPDNARAINVLQM